MLILVGLTIRLAFAFGFFGSGDVRTYYQWIDHLREGGNIYRTFEMYHWPPLPIFMIGGMGWVARQTGLPLYGLAALPPTFADICIGILIYAAAERENLPTHKRIALSALYLLNPISILVSSMHIQFGSVYMLPVLLAGYALIYQKKYKWAALWLGVGLSVTLIPVLFIPAFLAHLRSWRRRAVFLVLAGILPLVLTLPYLIDNFWLVVNGFLNYKSEYGIWGSSYLLHEFTTRVWVGPGEGFRGYARAYGSYGLLLLLILLGFTAFRRMALSNALSFTMLVFYLNPTGFANQYAILLLPLLVMEFRSRAAMWYTALGSAFVLTVYTGRYFYPWLMDLLPNWPNPTRLFSLPIWAWCVWEVGRRLITARRFRSAPLDRIVPSDLSSSPPERT